MFNIIFKIERWKWNEIYKVYVSSEGVVKNKKKKILPIIAKDGYCYVNTSRGYMSVHKIVMRTFHPLKNYKNMSVDHIDHNKRNNSLKNLQWMTVKENAEKDVLLGDVSKFEEKQEHMKQELHQQENIIKKRNETIKERGTRIRIQDQKISELDQIIHNLQLKVVNLEEEVKQKDNKINNMVWRIYSDLKDIDNDMKVANWWYQVSMANCCNIWRDNALHYIN